MCPSVYAQGEGFSPPFGVIFTGRGSMYNYGVNPQKTGLLLLARRGGLFLVELAQMRGGLLLARRGGLFLVELAQMRGGLLLSIIPVFLIGALL